MEWLGIQNVGLHSVAYSYDGSTWYSSVNSTTIFSNGGGLCVGTNAKLGPTMVNSGLYLGVNDRLVVNGPAYYDGGLASDTVISINMNLPVV